MQRCWEKVVSAEYRRARRITEKVVITSMIMISIRIMHHARQTEAECGEHAEYRFCDINIPHRHQNKMPAQNDPVIVQYLRQNTGVAGQSEFMGGGAFQP